MPEGQGGVKFQENQADIAKLCCNIETLYMNTCIYTKSIVLRDTSHPRKKMYLLQAFIAVVLLVLWTTQPSPRFHLVELFAGAGRVGEVWRPM